MAALPHRMRPLWPWAKRCHVMMTECIGPLARTCSQLFGERRLPRRAAGSTIDFAASGLAGGLTVDQVHPATSARHGLPVGSPPGHPAFLEQTVATFPPTFVAVVPQGHVLGPYGAVMTADGTLLFDVSPYFGITRWQQHPLYLQARLPPPVHLEGSVAVLTTRGGDSYFHFMLDVLPRLALLERAVALAALDRYVVNASRQFQRELLAQFGVPLDRIVQSTSFPHLVAKHLVVPSLPERHSRTPTWVVDFLRQRLLPETVTSTSRRVYVARGAADATRRVSNEEDVVAALRKAGVEPACLEGMGISDQVQLFAEAELVIAPHGAALTNILFCGPRTDIVEIFPPGYVNPCYWNLASAVGHLNYRYVMGAGREPRTRTGSRSAQRDFSVDIDRLLRNFG